MRFVQFSIAFLILSVVSLAALALPKTSSRQWVTFGASGGASLVRLSSVDLLVKADRTVKAEKKGQPDKHVFGVYLYAAGVPLGETFEIREMRDERFRAMSDLLGTLK